MAETILLEIVTPAKPLFSNPVELVIMPGASGDFGVLAGHAPMLSTLRPGTVEIREKNLKVIDRIFIDGGFAEVTPERCSVLAEEAIRVSEIDRDEAEARLKKAHDALMASQALGVRIAAERDVKAAEAMVEAVEAFHKAQSRG
jgi:F-type H+-transporting ATPase subunit epsilon